MGECRNGVEGPKWRLAAKSEMWGGIDMDREAIVGNEIFPGAWVIDVGHKTVDGGVVLADTRVIDVSHEAVDRGNAFASIVIVHPPVASA